MKAESRTSLAALRSAALLAIVIGAIGSIGFLRRAQQHPPPIIVVLFVVWVLAPFAVLGLAHVLSARWPELIRKTLYLVTIFVAVASLAIYLDHNVAHRAAKPAFVYVVTPPASVLLSAIAVALAAWKARKS
jgi:uncharacterized membrane protein